MKSTSEDNRMNHWSAVHPVLLATSADIERLSGAKKTQALSIAARKALAYSAQYSAVALGPLEKAENGAPLPSNNVFWSLSHTTDYVAAVTAPFPVGIDIEKIAPFPPFLVEKIARKAEWDLAPAPTESLFYRYWTAKEAVLKAVGTGLAGLEDCTVKEIISHTHMKLQYGSEIWSVIHHTSIAHHIAAVTSGPFPIAWHLAPAGYDSESV